MFGGFVFGGGPFGGFIGTAAGPLVAAATISFSASANLSLALPLTGSATISFATSARFTDLTASAEIHWSTSANLTNKSATSADITIDGVNVRPRVRMHGLTIRDILNDAPNTAALVMEGDGPAVGQSLRITLRNGGLVLFSGQIQQVEQTFDLQPAQVAWKVSAIDDTAAANYKRPFGAFQDVSATTIAQTLTAQFTPGYSTAGIEAGLPAVSIIFDGTDTFIAALTRLANVVGGYCKVEDRTVYLFTEDTGTPPDPIDETHCFMYSPQIRAHVDSSQLRTRVYGKGYGESVQADIAPGETLIPIEDGANYPPLGSQVIGATLKDGAQSEKFSYTGVVLRTGGSLVGPGAGPAGAPSVGLAVGAGVTSGRHEVRVVFVTATGSSLAGPSAVIDVGAVASPPTAPLAGVAINGTGPDQGSHDYVVTFAALGGETTPGPVSNAVTTSSASGQVAAPGAPYPVAVREIGKLDSSLNYEYRITFVTATGETQAGPTQFYSSPGVPLSNGSFTWTNSFIETGGNLTPGGFYRYFYSFVCPNGYETIRVWMGTDFTLGSTQNAIRFQNLSSNHPDGRVTKVRLYRTKYPGTIDPPGAQDGYLVEELTLPVNVANYIDTKADSALGMMSSQTPRGDDPGYQVDVTLIPIGPAGVTQRKIYRGRGTVPFVPHFLATIHNNTTTTYRDNDADNETAADMPTSNTTGTAVQRVPVSAIPIGPPGTASRNLYRRFNGSGPFKLVTTLANNTSTTFNDGVPNSSLGGSPPASTTAVGNQIAVSDIPRGTSTVTARELYMTGAGGTVFHRTLTIPDNTTTTATITMDDATLAGQPGPPTSDTSGLKQPDGQVPAGSTVLPVASSATFRASGGWVELGGDQVVRYTGISGQVLTGIPASGPGSITTTVLFGSQAMPAPMLIGATPRSVQMNKGAALHVWVQRDDLQAQAEQRARAGGDGVIEYVLVDERRGLPSLTDRCDAELAMFSRPLVTVNYATRDLKTKSGKLVTVNVSSPSIHEVLTIQDVTITEIDLAPGLAPRFTVQASSVRFTLEDTLRRLIAGGLVAGGTT